jgi:hypothetical protein
MEGESTNTGRNETSNAASSPPPASPAVPPNAPEPALFSAEVKLGIEITDALSGKSAEKGVDEKSILKLCRVVDYWLDQDTTPLIDGLGLLRLAQETKGDYVLASFLAWRGEYKLSYITLRSFLESFCLLLYYLNQGCDCLLYLRGKGYKLMLHRMSQKRQEPDEMHAFRRHYHLLISESHNSEAFAIKFFDEIGDCYNILSKAVHGDYSPKLVETPKDGFLRVLKRVLQVCNTLALHEPILDATDDDLEKALDGVLKPATFELRLK